jgi:ribosomal protein S12 methylthiotransferase
MAVVNERSLFMSYNISIISLGCSKNLIDSELMMGILSKNKFNLTEKAETADIIIVNTCGFIDSAKEESIDTILEVAQFKKTGNCKVLIVAGCLGERYKNELLNELPEVDGVVGTGNIYEIVDIINDSFKGHRTIRTGSIDIEYNENFSRIISTPKHTAYIKIAEGCDNYCTYCIIPKLRGKYRSRYLDSIIEEAKFLSDNGTKEIILIAQDTSKYGIDIYGKYMLPKLLDELNKIDGLEWIRLLYLYPETFTDELISSIKNNEKVVKYVDIPIQHINDRILKRMNRKTTKNMITGLVHKLRNEIPNIIIRTTIIVGFPGETDEEFNELCSYIEEMKFNRLGVFTYSKEEDTPAALLDNQITEHVKENRQKIIMEKQKIISYTENKQKIGSNYKILVEEKVNDNSYIGRTYMDSPEIDGAVYIDSKESLKIGTFYNVKITDCLEYDLMGEIINEFSE